VFLALSIIPKLKDQVPKLARLHTVIARYLQRSDVVMKNNSENI
jgi:hypothetical protein